MAEKNYFRGCQWSGAKGDRVAAAYGSNDDRLVEIKKQCDSQNVFHLNQSINF